MKLFPILALLLCCSYTSLQASCEYHQTISVEELPIGAMLYWTTISESENAMFKIEKSLDGIHFTEIGSINGAGNSKEQKSYSFLDINCKAKKNFYRLKQIDFNGAYSYSEISPFELKSSNQLVIVDMSPAATTSAFDFSIDATTTGKLQYHLEDWKGNKLHVAKSDITVGLNKIQVNLKEVPLGIYRIVLQFGEEQETLTIKKIKAHR